MANRKQTEIVVAKDCATTQFAACDRGRNVRGLGGRRDEMGRKPREFVRRHFLIARRLRDCLTTTAGLSRDAGDRLELE